MTTPQPGTRRARLASLLVAAAGLTAATAPVAPAADPSSGPVTGPAVSAAVTPAAVTLTTAEITGDTLTLAGTVTNTTTEPLTEVAVALWRSPALLRSPAAVAGALAAETTTPGTAAVVEPGNRVTITGQGDALTPGAIRPFTVSGSLAALGLTQTDATWWVGANVTGGRAGSRSASLGTARTLVSLPGEPLPVVQVVEFSAPPRQVKENLFTDEGLLTDITDGRLGALLDRAEEGGGSWVVDPSLLMELTDMTDGYRVRSSDGSTAGTGEEAAQAWLTRFQALPPRGAVGLFGSPDLSTVARLDDATLVDALHASGGATLDGRTALTVVDTPDAATLTLAGTLTRPVIAVDARARALRVATGGVDAVVARTTGPVATSPLLPDTDLTRRAARFATARASGGEVRWVRSVEDAPKATDALPQGFRVAALADVLTGPTQPWEAPADRTGNQALDGPHLSRVLNLRRMMIAYGDAAPEAGVGSLADAQTVRAASRWWNEDPASLDRWLDALADRVGAATGAMVSLDASSRFTMTGDTSEFPVTVTNHLIDPVTVRVDVESDNPQRIWLTAPDAVTVAPGASSTVMLQANAAGGGIVRASVHATTPSGHRLTPDREVVVETTNYGTIGWVIVVVSGVVLVLTTAHRIRQVRTRRKGEDG